MKTEIDVGF